MQFDQELYIDENTDPRQSECAFVTYTPKVRTHTASKFAVCFIVNGPPLSGKTTIAKGLSSAFDLPILDLKSLWTDPGERATVLYTTLCEATYRAGVIIDGLDISRGPGENETFLQQCIKQKNIMDEFGKHPLTVPNHVQQSAPEKAIDAVLASLDGHFVFQIAIQLPQDESSRRHQVQSQDDEQMKAQEELAEKERLFAMTEADYHLLSKDDRRAVDQKRRQFRRQMLRDMSIEVETQHKEAKDTGKGKLNQMQMPTKKKIQKIVIPQDPVQLQGMVFQFSLGSVAQRLQTSAERFNFIDTIDITHAELTSEHSVNTILINGMLGREEVMDKVPKFLPPMRLLRELTFRMQIPEPSVLKYKGDSLKWVKMRQFFSVLNDDQQRSKVRKVG
jgi:adenylate kinase family enzyme